MSGNPAAARSGPTRSTATSSPTQNCVKAFQPDTVDGLRTDVAGRLYVARILKGTIALMKPNGAVEREIALKGKEPTNLAFGGSDGKTVFVTQRQGGFVESFRTDQQGREHCLQRGRC